MTGFKSIDDLEVELQTGQGVAVVVEGESYEEDPWFYGQWFGDRAREVTFYPQDGWTRVVSAVSELRLRCPGIPIYGIIDRDFCEETEIDAEFDPKGVIRTPRYTLENYLLDAACWATVFKRIFRRNPVEAYGWDDERQITEKIKSAYADCLSVTVHNWVVKIITAKYASPATPSRKYLKEYKAMQNQAGVLQSLMDWGSSVGATENLHEMFANRLDQLRLATVENLAQRVSGKFVLRRFIDLSPPRSGKRFDLDHYLNLYMETCTEPPKELAVIIDRIILHAGR